MIVFILVIVLMTGTAVVLSGPKPNSIWLAGIFTGSALLTVGFMYYFAKSGGLPGHLEWLFFVAPRIRRFFEYATITIDEMSRLLAVGRAVFLFFSAGFAVAASDRFHRRAKAAMYAFAGAYSLLNYVIYEPVVYARLFGGDADQWEKGTATAFRLCNTVYMLATAALFFVQWRRLKTPWLKNQFMVIVIAVLSQQLIFCLFGILSPMQVSHAFAVNSAFLGKLYYGWPSQVQWYTVIAVGMISAVLGTIALWKYNRMQAAIGKPELTLEKRLKANHLAVRVYTHATKNQLLAQKVILRKIGRAVQESRENNAEIAKYVEQLQLSNEQMLQRMDELYNTFKTNRMFLKPTPVRDIYREAIDKFGDNGMMQRLRTKTLEDADVLADKPYLIQAICNLLSNAFDAIQAKYGGDGGNVDFNVYRDGEMVVLEIRDDGIGIERGARKNIFEPFFTTKNTNNNWGLGLSYVQQTVKAHYGYVRFESTAGEGTVFYVFLPAYRGSAGKA
jgi:signal transduction histidine kinase